eukprot:833609-Prymnesium_polylepis.1
MLRRVLCGRGVVDVGRAVGVLFNRTRVIVIVIVLQIYAINEFRVTGTARSSHGRGASRRRLARQTCGSACTARLVAGGHAQPPVAEEARRLRPALEAAPICFVQRP